MIKPKRLKEGDTVMIVSLSSGMLGEKEYIHKLDLAKDRLEKTFKLKVKVSENCLKGEEFLYAHPELRAKDLMDAFLDKSVDAIICSIGGDDTIRLLPFIDFDIIKNNPKIFMGYSDTTANHFMMNKAGLVSFYGPTVMGEFGAYVKMNEYTEKSVFDVLFNDTINYEIKGSDTWSGEFILWTKENFGRTYNLIKDENGYELLQGEGTVRGRLLGGCIELFMMMNGTSIWPSLEEWKDKILFFETSEEKPSPNFVKWTLRNLAQQGILKNLKGILVGKPQGKVYYEEYKQAILSVVRDEEKLANLPIIYNMNFGHAIPIGTIPYGIMAEINCEKKSVTLLENATIE